MVSSFQWFCRRISTDTFPKGEAFVQLSMRVYRFSFSNFSMNWTSFSTPSMGMAL